MDYNFENTPAINKFLSELNPTREDTYLAYVDRDELLRRKFNLDIVHWNRDIISTRLDKLNKCTQATIRGTLSRHIVQCVKQQVPDLIDDLSSVPNILTFNVNITEEYNAYMRIYRERQSHLSSFINGTLEEFYKELTLNELNILGW